MPDTAQKIMYSLFVISNLRGKKRIEGLNFLSYIVSICIERSMFFKDKIHVQSKSSVLSYNICMNYISNSESDDKLTITFKYACINILI